MFSNYYVQTKTQIVDYEFMINKIDSLFPLDVDQVSIMIEPQKSIK